MNLRKDCLAVIYSSVRSTRFLALALLAGLVGCPCAFGQDQILNLASHTGGTYDYLINSYAAAGLALYGNGQTAFVISGLSGVTNAAIITPTQDCGAAIDCSLPIGQLSNQGLSVPGLGACGVTVGAFDSGSVTVAVVAPPNDLSCTFNNLWFGTLQITSTVTTAGNANAAIYIHTDPASPPVNQTITGPVATPTYSCIGFQSPFNVALSLSKKTNRAIPLKAQLFDSNNNLITPTTLGTAAPPVVNISYQSGTSPAVNDTSLLDPLGSSSSGNQFNFDSTTQTWWFNLATSPFTGSGTYTITLHAGDSSYLVVPQCSGQFVRP